MCIDVQVMQIVPACRAEASAELLRQYEGPTAFAIPGNHDWIDGLETYTRHIQHKGWLGGWLLPQVGLYAPRCFCLPKAHVLGSITGVPLPCAGIPLQCTGP